MLFHGANLAQRTLDNVQRFSLGGAAHRTPREGSAVETAQVSEKRVGLSRWLRRPGYGRLMSLDPLTERTIGAFGSPGWHLSGYPPGFRAVRGGGA